MSFWADGPAMYPRNVSKSGDHFGPPMRIPSGSLPPPYNHGSSHEMTSLRPTTGPQIEMTAGAIAAGHDQAAIAKSRHRRRRKLCLIGVFSLIGLFMIAVSIILAVLLSRKQTPELNALAASSSNTTTAVTETVFVSIERSTAVDTATATVSGPQISYSTLLTTAEGTTATVTVTMAMAPILPTSMSTVTSSSTLRIKESDKTINIRGSPRPHSATLTPEPPASKPSPSSSIKERPSIENVWPKACPHCN